LTLGANRRRDRKEPFVIVLWAAQQRIGGYDAYDALGAGVAASAALILAVRVVLRPAGQRRIGRDGVNELLILLMLVGFVILILHQGITDGLCHGSCP